MAGPLIKGGYFMQFDIMLLVVLTICTITDLKYRKIYNKVIFPFLLLAIILNSIYGGFSGLKLSIIGFATGFGMLLIPYFMGGFGAGDVKLLGLIGAIKGSQFAFYTGLYMALIGGAIAIIIIIFNKETINFIKSLFWWLVGFFRGIHYKFELPTSVLLKKYPYGVAISGGALICLMFKGAMII